MNGSKGGYRVLRFICVSLLCGVAFGNEVDPASMPNSSEQPPAEVRLRLDQYLQSMPQREGWVGVNKELVCFMDAEDERLGKASRSVSGRPTVLQRAADDCWLVLLDTHIILDLWLVDGKWRVLCPTTGREDAYGGKGMSEQDLHRLLNTEEMKQVQGETDTQLERRRNRYVAALVLKQRDHQIKNLWVYYSGIPTEDAAALRKMAPVDFRKAVLLKLDALDGLRYRLELQAESLREERLSPVNRRKSVAEGQPVHVIFSLENVTTKPVRLMYGPLVHLFDMSKGGSAWGGPAVPAKNANRRPGDPYTLWHPFDKQELVIAPGQTTTLDVTLTDYYDLHVASYCISAHLEEPGEANDGYWHGVARADTVSFVVRRQP
jgi:hypothetical protein